MIAKCPGQDRRNIKVELIRCACGYEAEIFSDEMKIGCPGCKTVLSRTRLPSCTDWCKFAGRCIGEDKVELMPEA
ncbi:MAG: phosphohydrolase [Candidatus Omnitrophica bacterium]|nr:phosphohydrolase [Candidatus Omnitrophota bacterium]